VGNLKVLWWHPLSLRAVNKFATDVLLFTTSEFGFFTVADELTTGSSIMPQKKNIDVAELLRSKVHILLGHYSSIVGISSNLPSGYNRDLQDTKKPLMESLEISSQSISIAKLFGI
jgi:argininosuccinate lyase